MLIKSRQIAHLQILSFAERDAEKYFVPLIRQMLASSIPFHRLLGLKSLQMAIQVVGSRLSRFNYILGPVLSPYVQKEYNGAKFLSIAMDCWPTVRSPSNNIEDIHNEVMKMVTYMKERDKRVSNKASVNLHDYCVIDFERHLIPVVSSFK